MKSVVFRNSAFAQRFSHILSYLTLLNYIDVQMIIAEA